MNIQSILLLIGLILIVGAAVYGLMRRKRQGKHSCGCCAGNCSECIHSRLSRQDKQK